MHEYLARIRQLRWQAMSVRGLDQEAPPVPSSHAGSSNAPGPAEQQAASAKHAMCSPEAALPGSWHGCSSLRKLATTFSELPERGMDQLAVICKDSGLEELFLTALKITK